MRDRAGARAREHARVERRELARRGRVGDIDRGEAKAARDERDGAVADERESACALAAQHARVERRGALDRRVGRVAICAALDAVRGAHLCRCA